MPNVNDLKRFLKVDMVKNGDLIHFCDAGTISEKEFEQEGKKKKQPMLEMEVMIGDIMKKIIYSPNSTTRSMLQEAWGPNTESWVGETGQVSIIEQLSFGKLTPVLVVKPVTNLKKAAIAEASVVLRKPAPQVTAPFQAKNPGGVIDPKDIAWEE